MAGEDRTVGLWFHSVKNGEVEWQGQVVGLAGNSGYEVQLYDWLMGAPSVTKLVTFEEIQGWRFYPTDDLMRAAGCINSVQFPAMRRIQCPRCSAVGSVHQPAGRQRRQRDFVVAVLWRRDSKVWLDMPSDRETHDPHYGCGYDKEKNS